MSRIKISIFLVLSIFFFLKFSATVIPKDGSRINYSQVYFEEDLVKGAHSYELVLYNDSALGVERAFFLRTSCKVPAFRASGLSFSANYFWRVEAYDAAHTLLKMGKVHTFSIIDVMIAFADAQYGWLDIKTNKSDKHAGGLLLIDYTRSIYTREGKAVWTLPDIPDLVNEETQIRDMKITRDNTITFLTDRHAVEVDLDATILWKAPWPFVFGKDTIIYHHDLKKTPRGTYMVLGTRKVSRLMLGQYTEQQLKNESEITYIDKKPYKKTQVTVLLEFDRNGKLLWFWDANTYISDADLTYKKYESGHPVFSSHSNAFSESEDGKTVYIGFRDLSRILKIDKATKKVKTSYGEKYPSGDARVANHLFRKQHDGTITKRKTLLIFNNNEAGEGKVSSVIEIKEDAAPGDSALVWSFPINFDNLTTGFSPGGGNVTELPNSNLLLCAGSLNRIFEVTRNKEVVWDALMKMRVKDFPDWRPFPQYRCSWLPYMKDFHFIPVLSDSSSLRQLKLDLTNTGNDEDAYTVEVIAGGKVIYKTKTKTLPANESVAQSINLKSVGKGIKTVAIRITSERGRLTREIVYNL